MHNLRTLSLILGLLPWILISCQTGPAEVPDIPPTPVVPSPQQIAYQEMELIGFVHFTVNTFTDKEWGYGDESPDIFQPDLLDATQWASAAKAAGMQELILTAKHHDGFCLWPSSYTDHSVANSPWREGEGDVVREFVDACRAEDLKVGLYLSPWDRNHPDYGSPEYITYFRNQLTELLTEYGEISEVWFDGANGGDGYYGGARETRRIDRTTYYDWPETWNLVRELQPDALMFSDAGPDIRWIGNEHGFAGETCWSTMSTKGIVPGQAEASYLNTGDPKGSQWIVGECDVSIRPGWFYHSNQDSLVKSPQQLVDIYYKSVGRNGTLLLNIPPTPEGLFHPTDIAHLKAFREIIDETFARDLAAGAEVSADGVRAKHPRFSPQNLTDGDPQSYWAAPDEATTATLEIALGEATRFDRIVLQEPIRFGQRIARFAVDAEVDGGWQEIASATTIGYKRILRIPPVTSAKVRIRLLESLYPPALSTLSLYKASKKEETP